MTRYVTIKQLCEHADKHRVTVALALKRAKIPAQRIPGVHGLRITEKDANRFLALQWPDVGPIQPKSLTILAQ